MARYTGPKVRLSRKFGEDIFGNTTKRMQGRNQNVRRRKTSEYILIDGVGLFFVLSGFLIGGIFIKDFEMLK